LRRLVDVALAKFGGIDVVVNAAGDVKQSGLLLELWHDDDYAASQLRTNCLAPIELVSAVHQACWKDESRQNAERNRCVINVGCMSGVTVYGESGKGTFAAAAAALNMLTLHLSLELAPYSVRANAVCAARTLNQPAIAAPVAAVKKLMSNGDTGTIVLAGT
jgi:NAD(P)-dependent dehydrogenase (short-subunit alcohol dehydrogenase family)